MKYLFSLLLLPISALAFSEPDSFYSKAYGDAKNPSVIFLHGGPGYNSVSFEYSTAEILAAKGFYVVVYDQRGSGRTTTKTENSLFTFKEAMSDLDSIYSKYSITKSILIGHSFGGTLGIIYTKNHPDKVKSLVLVGSPISYQVTFRGIIARCKKVYAKTNKEQLQYLSVLEKMDTNSLEYSGYCFMHAMSSGAYKTKKVSAETKAIYESMKKCKDAAYLIMMTQEPVQGFYDNESYTTLNLTDTLNAFKGKVPVCGIYGDEDGLFDAIHFNLLKSNLGEKNLTIIKGASHNVFIDQQKKFLDVFVKYVGEKKY